MEGSLYDRQDLIPLKTDLNIAIIGCGGVGFWVAKFAAMSGIKNLFLYDPDTIEIHNLNRLDMPTSFLGKNKAMATQEFIELIRPECDVRAYPFPFQSHHLKNEKLDYLIDCTDRYDAQQTNESIAKSRSIKYKKIGYDGTRVSINNVVARWGESQDGYVVTPSWVVPASIVAALGVASIMKYFNKEMGCDIGNLFL